MVKGKTPVKLGGTPRTCPFRVVATFPATDDYKAQTLEVTVCHNLNEGPDI